MEQRGQVTATWTDHDVAIWHTGDIARQLIAGRVHERPDMATAFPPQLGGAGERVLASGPIELLTYRAVGDGSYERAGSPLFLGGRGALAATGLAVAVTALKNGRRRNAAAGSEFPRWVVDDRGGMYVSTHGFYLQSATGLYPWSWRAVKAAELTAPATVQVHGHAQSGPVSWQLRSIWSELLFVVWAMAVHPEHPQLVSGAWIPPTWPGRRSRAQAVVVRPGRCRLHPDVERGAAATVYVAR